MNEPTFKKEVRRAWKILRRLAAYHQNVLFFMGGFFFDAFTLDRIDAWLDLALQGGYIAVLTVMILLQQRAALGRWRPQGYVARAWVYNVEALHFLFGGLLSAYVIFYTRSGVNVRTFLFFAAAGALLVYNELPESRRWGLSLRLALYTFCVASFQIYFVPVIVGRMGDAIFCLSILLTAVLVGLLLGLLACWEDEMRATFQRLAVPAALTLVAITVFYFMRWIPPVPLEMKFAGIYHKVEHAGKDYVLTYERGPWYAFLRRQDRPFYARKGDRIYCFVRVFAPTRFTHKISLHWLSYDSAQGWISRDRIPLPIRGGRAEGYRGYAYKEKFQPGRWRVQVETEDGRVLGELPFAVAAARGAGRRRWKTVKS
ncbi:MAG: DUF2914 domain-containing protein [Elusimicrobiota bacterium]